MATQNKKLIETLERAAAILMALSTAGILGKKANMSCASAAADCKAQAELERQGR